MNKYNVKVFDKLVTMNTVRRGNWLIKISIFNGQILLIASHLLDLEKVEVKTFWKSQDVYNYIEFLIKD